MGITQASGNETLVLSDDGTHIERKIMKAKAWLKVANWGSLVSCTLWGIIAVAMFILVVTSNNPHRDMPWAPLGFWAGVVMWASHEFSEMVRRRLFRHFPELRKTPIIMW